jgi:hypothetical protein
MSICNYWVGRRLNGGEFLDQTRSFLLAIRSAMPELVMLKVCGDPSEGDWSVANDFANFEEKVIASLPEDWAYIGPDLEYKGFTKQSIAAIRFRVSFIISSDDGRKEIYVGIGVGGWHNSSPDTVNIQFSPEIEDIARVRKLFDLCVNFWRADNACAGRDDELIWVKPPIGNMHMGWITYLADAGTRVYLPEGIRWEPLPPGIVVYASEEPRPRNGTGAREKENMKRIIDALGPHGGLNRPS